MRLAGNLEKDILQLRVSSGTPEAQWPSRHNPVPATPPVYRYDDHMKDFVPNVPIRKV